MNIADMYYVGPDYHKAFQIPVIEGNIFTPTLTDTLSQQVMVSRQFVERMNLLVGWTGSPSGSQCISPNIGQWLLSVGCTKIFT